MIAKRFRSVGWAGCVAVAALGCYLVTQQVAAERAAVERLDRQLAQTRVDIRKLRTELVTRSRLPVLEQWNRNVLALSAPSASQYLHGEVELARFDGGADGVTVQLAAATVSEPARTESAPAEVKLAAASSEAAQQPLLRHANYVKPAGDGFDSASARNEALLDDALLSDLKRAALTEKRGAGADQ